MLQTQTVSSDTLSLIKVLMADSRLNDFILVGGTCLALELGHRQSIDIDLFSTTEFNSKEMSSMLQQDYNADIFHVLGNTVVCTINGVKVDILTHAYPYVVKPRTEEGIRMASLADISAMKLLAVINSGKRVKDFVDIHYLLEKMPLSDMYMAYEQKYNDSWKRAKDSLLYHKEIDHNIPILLIKEQYDWEKISKRLMAAVERPQEMFLSQGQPAKKPDIKQKPSHKPKINKGKGKGKGPGFKP